MKDVFDEFEFKPLTEGLGFHKNKTNLTANSMHSSGESILENKMPELINTPLPRSSKNSGEASEQSNHLYKQPTKSPTKPTTKPLTNNTSNTVDAILNEIKKTERLDFIESKTTPAVTQYVKTINDFSAIVLDSMLVLAAYLACLIILLVVTKVDLMANLANPDPQGMVYWSLLSMCLGVAWIYLVVTRAFLGQTPGEWVFDQRLGNEKQFQEISYVLKVAGRSLLVVTSGFILFPLLSWILNTDILGKFFDLSLEQKVN